jgi:hypothetical protein
MAGSAGIALLSVYDKTGIAEFAKGLNDLGWQIYASGGTAKAVQDAGIDVTDVSSLVGGDAILGHRVVTLSREISAGLLADKASQEDLDEMTKLGLPIIDLVCVDMYPLEEAINKQGSTKAEVVLQTDIGGPTMLRSAAKGRRIVLSHVSQRQPVLEWLRLASQTRKLSWTNCAPVLNTKSPVTLPRQRNTLAARKFPAWSRALTRRLSMVKTPSKPKPLFMPTTVWRLTRWAWTSSGMCKAWNAVSLT